MAARCVKSAIFTFAMQLCWIQSIIRPKLVLYCISVSYVMVMCNMLATAEFLAFVSVKVSC